jgi:Replicative DNA helicase
MAMKTMAMGRSEQSEPRLPPQNLEAEQCILGAILLDNPAMAKAMELITEEDFYRTLTGKSISPCWIFPTKARSSITLR